MGGEKENPEENPKVAGFLYPVHNGPKKEWQAPGCLAVDHLQVQDQRKFLIAKKKFH